MCKRIFLLLAFGVLSGTSLALSQEPPTLFTVVPENSLNPEQAARLSKVKQRKTTATYQVVTIPIPTDVQRTPYMEINFQAGDSLRARQKYIEIRSENDFTWVGLIDGKFSQVILVVNPMGVTGTIRLENDLYKIESLGEDKHVLIKIDQSKFGRDHPPGYENGSLKQDNNSTLPKSTGKNFLSQAVYETMGTQSSPQIDLLVAYTPAVLSAYPNISGLIQMAKTETNTSYQNSQANVTVDVVYEVQVNYSEAGKTYPQHLSWFKGDTAVNYMRDQVGADVCILLVDDQSSNGLSAGLPANNPSQGFCVVNYDNATGYYSFGHEIGHLHGAEHQYDEAKENHPRHGYIYQNIWRTIMVTSTAGEFSRIQYWSNPNVNHPTDNVPMGTTTRENNVGAALNSHASTLSNFRSTGNPQPPAPPSNLVITNESQIGQSPNLTWTASPTPGVNTYRVYRCNNYYQSCAATETVIATTSATSFTDWTVEITTKSGATDRYRYHVRAVQFGLESTPSNYEEVWGEIPFKAEDEQETSLPLPNEFALHQNFPNPFNPVTRIRYELPKATVVRLIVYDIAGREVARLVDGIVEAGHHSVLFDGSRLTSGVYIYKLEAGAFSQTARMILAK